MKIETGTERFYLKQTTPALYIEADILEMLSQRFKIHVPEIVAKSNLLHCFLMRDAGLSLHNYLKDNFQPQLLCEAIEQFTHMQRVLENSLDDFFALGVPDYRLTKLPELYSQLISQHVDLTQAGISATEIQKLHKLQDAVTKMCQSIAKYNIPESLVQPDCNANNILYNNLTNIFTFVDLGEISIAHPFLSVNNFVNRLPTHEGINEQDPMYQQIRAASLKNWLNILEQSELVAAFNAVNYKLKPLCAALAHYRLLHSVDPEEYKIYYLNKTNQLATNLRDLISNLEFI